MTATDECIVGRHVLVHDRFLPESLAAGLLDRMVDGRDHYEDSGTRRGTSSHRRSLQFAAVGFGDLANEFVEHLDVALVEAAPGFGIAPASLKTIELSAAAWTAGSYYYPHRDQSLEGPEADRRLSAVLFLHAAPRGFSGGELSIVETRIRGQSMTTGDHHAVVEPDHNRLVVFDSRAIHEVRSVDVPSGAFRDSRFSLTSWAYGA